MERNSAETHGADDESAKDSAGLNDIGFALKLYLDRFRGGPTEERENEGRMVSSKTGLTLVQELNITRGLTDNELSDYIQKTYGIGCRQCTPREELRQITEKMVDLLGVPVSGSSSDPGAWWEEDPRVQYRDESDTHDWHLAARRYEALLDMAGTGINICTHLSDDPAVMEALVCWTALRKWLVRGCTNAQSDWVPNMTSFDDALGHLEQTRSTAFEMFRTHLMLVSAKLEISEKQPRHFGARWSPFLKFETWQSLFKFAGQPYGEKAIKARVEKGIFIKNPKSAKAMISFDINSLPVSMQAESFWNTLPGGGKPSTTRH